MLKKKNHVTGINNYNTIYLFDGIQLQNSFVNCRQNNVTAITF